MSDSAAERLQMARQQAGYARASDAARAMGVPVPTYLAHENPDMGKGLSRAGQRYARFFRVSLEWLLTGRGDMRGLAQTIPIMGHVGAGSTVEPIGDTSGNDVPLDIGMPNPEHLAALIVRGESQWPRYLDGEVILYDTRPRRPQDLANTYAVVDLSDGRRMIKLLRAGRSPGTWILESHNAAPEPTTEILGVYAVQGTLARR